MYTDCWCIFLPCDLPDINIYYFLYVKLQTKNIRHYQFTIPQTWIDCLNLASFASTMKWHFTDTDFSGTLQWVYNTWIIVYCKYCKWESPTFNYCSALDNCGQFLHECSAIKYWHVVVYYFLKLWNMWLMVMVEFKGEQWSLTGTGNSELHICWLTEDPLCLCNSAAAYQCGTGSWRHRDILKVYPYWHC